MGSKINHGKPELDGGLRDLLPVSTRCFVATAVYGDVNAPEVRTLRDFRDNVLAESGLGRAVIALYYNGLGERVAKFVQDHIPSAIPIIRKGLDYVIKRYESSKLTQ